MQQPPPPPEHVPPPSEWSHVDLYRDVRDAVSAIPAYFKSETHIAGINATDLHTLNSVLGATIEDHTVSTLNIMRGVWDPQKLFGDCAFVRQPQTFPDVLLRRGAAGGEILMGIELKGWYVLSHEGEPNFRFTVTPEACAPVDLLVVVPWALSHVISGRPIMFDPYVENARYAAEHRNYWWQYLRKAKGKTGVIMPSGAAPYPSKSDRIDDKPEEDGGGNFGRFARTGFMDTYTTAVKAELLCGVPIGQWLDFFKGLVARP